LQLLSIWKLFCRHGREEHFPPLLRTIDGINVRRNWGHGRENEIMVVHYRDPEATTMIMG